MSKLWGGRFSKNTHKLVEQFTGSIHFDYKLAHYDCIGSLVHIAVLKKAKLISNDEFKALDKGLKKILLEIEQGTFTPDKTYEDIHSYIQALLEKPGYAGKAALKLHTCRSRNDQVVFDMKLYCLDEILKTERHLTLYSQSLSQLGKKYGKVCIPGYTHLQHAIPVGFSDYCLAYEQMAARDEIRLMNVFNTIDLTLGSGALAGTMIDDRFYEQKMTQPIKADISSPTCPMDVVSDRDFAIDILHALSMTGMHLSRLAEDLILWSTTEFGFINIDDAFCTGSSLMPQKKNPDVLELIRGYTGRLYGNLNSVMVLMKGLPLSYNRDMQLDKEPLFDSFRIIQDELKILAELLCNVTLNEKTIARQLDDESLYATDIADYLVEQKVPFKTAHGLVGKLIQQKDTQKIKIVEMNDDQLQQIHPALTQKIVRMIIDPTRSITAKKSIKRKRV